MTVALTAFVEENLEKIKDNVNKHLEIFSEQLEESYAKLKEHRHRYGDYYYRTDDNPQKTTELVLQSALKDLRLQIKAALEIIEIVDRINKNSKDPGRLPPSKSSTDEPFDPDKWLKESATQKKSNQDDQ